jgi:enterochelin esterase family protein
MAPLAAQARGTLHRHVVPSAIFGEARELLVYTPPGYDAAAAEPYPILVLLHGAMGRPSEWIDEVHADRLLEDLIARGAAAPMLLVLPESHGFGDPAHRAAQVFGASLPQQRQWMEALGRSLDGETLPFLARTYRVRAEAAGRALVGFSMGGAEALYLGLRRTERFGWIGAIAGAYPLLGQDLDEALPRPTPPPHLLWLTCGEQDLLLGPNRAVAAHLGASLRVGPGGHTPAACGDALGALLPLLFRP